MRADSLAGQVVAVLSRRTPALQPAPGQPATILNWIHRLFFLLQQSRKHAARTTATVVRDRPDISTVPPEWRPASADLGRAWHPRPLRHFITGIAVLATVAISVVEIPTAFLASQIHITSAGPAPHDSTSAAIDASRGVSTPIAPASIAPGGIPSSSGAQSGSPSPVRSSGTSTPCPTQGLGGESTSPACATVAATAGPPPAAASSPPPATSPPPTAISPPPTATPAPTPQTNVASPTPSSCTVPTVTSISPSQGSEAGGDTVTITGTGFAAGAKVSFGSASAKTTAIQSSTKIIATSPPGPPGQSVVDVTVACSGVVSPVVSSDQFTYVMAAPSATPTAPASSVSATGERQNPSATVR